MQLHDLWLPPLPDDLPIFVALHESSVRIRRPELRISRHPRAPAAISLDNLRGAPVPDAALACARDLGVLDLVVLIDGALHLEKCTLADLQAAAATVRPGSRRPSEALRWCDRGRDADLAKAGYVRHGWVASQVRHDSWLILRAAMDALGRELTVDDIRPWWKLLEASLFSRSGTTTMRRTWRLPEAP